MQRQSDVSANSGHEYAEKLWREDIILENLDKISRGSSEGILKSDYLNPQNALFKFASERIKT